MKPINWIYSTEEHPHYSFSHGGVEGYVVKFGCFAKWTAVIKFPGALEPLNYNGHSDLQHPNEELAMAFVEDYVRDIITSVTTEMKEAWE